MLRTQHQAHSYSLWHLLRQIRQHRHLLFSLIRREILARYQGSLLGLIWPLVYPLLMLAVYTFVFSVVFKARWTSLSDSKAEFALVLFAGMAVFAIFSDMLSRAPTAVTANANYVKKLVFPLEMLALVNLGSALFHALISLSMWLLVYLCVLGVPPVTLWQFPLILLPLISLSLGCSWFFSALGVYVRDIQQVVLVLVAVLSFLSPVFYPLQALPVEFQDFLAWSPLAIILEQSRDTLIWGKPLLWSRYIYLNLVSLGLAWLGYVWFQKTRKGFADVL